MRALTVSLLGLPLPASAQVVQAPPESLAQYYPPKAIEDAYTFHMLELGRLFGTASADLDDASLHLGDSLRALDKKLDEVVGLVPEWRHYFPDVDFEALAGEAGTEQGRKELGAALERLSAACTNCHSAEMFAVQALYHWPDFWRVEVRDAQAHRHPFHHTMVALSNEMAALPRLVERGEWDAAQAHYEELYEQFSLLEQSCTSCHEQSREYFVDKTVKARILEVGGHIRAQEGDVERCGRLMDEITNASCIPCHQVHMPAAFLQRRLRGG